ncbi:trehalose operon repressor [Neobacillus piezotolerans]|uniref:Trehalose operon repressor n=1 Tax=Neobacillus piezotolerans TaxID=2259171 RepID=A0A3D8GT27_9BACI|nr:trehalose operon repressor [Neobacillus piezotolerans]RDU37620.1 trehalose operon repressor [Neobacillus piezotolerans]
MVTNKYDSIYQDIAAQIESGKLKKHTKLPSENELSEAYGTSRETIRKALNLLSQHGYIQKIKAKGSIVLDIGRFDFPVSGLTSFKEVAEKVGQQFHTTVHELYVMKPDSFLQNELKISAKEEVWKVARTREKDGERIILDKSFFVKKYVPGLTKEICEDSIYAYLEGDLNLNISFARKEITVEECTDEDRTYLDLNGYNHIVVVRNNVFLDNASLIEYTESRHRLDKFRFVDFARRSR